MSASIVDSSPLPLHSVSERWQFLATLPETALLEFVRAQSRTTNVNWLDTMVDGGLLRVPDAIKGQLGEKNPNGLREAIDAGLMTSNGLLAACDPATAREVSRAGRSGVYDVEVTNQNGRSVAHFRGLSRTVRGKHLSE